MAQLQSNGPTRQSPRFEPSQTRIFFLKIKRRGEGPEFKPGWSHFLFSQTPCHGDHGNGATHYLHFSYQSLSLGRSSSSLRQIFLSSPSTIKLKNSPTPQSHLLTKPCTSHQIYFSRKSLKLLRSSGVSNRAHVGGSLAPGRASAQAGSVRFAVQELHPRPTAEDRTEDFIN